MFLVVGLAIAGVVGIAAAFYFSIRSGGNKRLRTVGAGHAGADRRPRSRSGGTARPDRADNASRTANGRRPANTGRAANGPSRNYRTEASTGPNPVLDFGDPVLADGRRGGPGVSAGDSQATDPRLAAAEGGAGRPRRRVGFRKGADVDEELWPAESFGGVSDEQFWNDVASDKPLTTTARTAQQDPGTRNRPFNALPPSAATPPVAKPPQAKPPQAKPPLAKPPVATQSVQTMAPQVPGATQPVRIAAGTSSLTSAPSQPRSAPSQPRSAPSQPRSVAAQPAEPRARRRASRSDDEDPLTSAAFSLRSSGPVDGRSSRRSPASYSGTAYGDPSSATQAINTPPYGENYEYGSGGSPAAQPDDPRRQNGARSHARHGGTGEATRAGRQAYPQDGYQGTGSYPAGGYQGTGSHQSTGSHRTDRYPTGGYPTEEYLDGGQQGNGQQIVAYQGSAQQASANARRGNGNGHRAPYDPREDYRRLTPLN
jgi:hypothetical protein